MAGTILLDPTTGDAAIPVFPVAVMSRREAYSEKIRAALTRREPAIRDIYDVDQAVRNGILDLADVELLRLIRKKLDVEPDRPPDVSADRVALLLRQLPHDLHSVLRHADLDQFDFDRALARLQSVARILTTVGP